MSKPSLDETYRALCAVLKTDPKLSTIVTNHIVGKHSIHTLPAFQTSESITDEEKLETYGEIIRALTTKNYTLLKGRVASGQAASEEPKAEPETVVEEIPTRAPVKAKRIPDIPAFKPEEPERAPTPPPAPRPSDPLTDRLRDLLREVIGELPAALDEERVKEIADERGAEIKRGLAQLLSERDDAITSNVSKMFDKAMEEARANIPAAPSVTRHEIQIGETINAVEGLMHCQMLQIATWIAADVPVWVWGNAGGGKTHLARQVAESLGLKFYAAAIDETITVGKLVGFRNVATGEFVEGLIYRAYKEGGVQLLDEIDTNATAIASLNSLIANGHYTFPNGEEVTRHKDFRVIAGANTKGTGAVAGYTARVRLDAATLDRFAVIRLEYDRGLESALALGVPNTSPQWKPTGTGATNAALCERWVHWVQQARTTVGDALLISPRASYLGVKALRANVPPGEVAEALVFKLASPDTRQRILSAAGNPATL